MIYSRQDIDGEIKTARKQVIVFAVLTFAITYLTNFIMLFMYGPISMSTINGSTSQWQSALSLQMLFPAFSAIVCMIIFRDGRLTKPVMIFLGYFLLYFLVSVVSIFYNPAFTVPSGSQSLPPVAEMKLYDILTLIMGLGGIVLFIVLNLKKEWRQQLKPAKLSPGTNGYYYLAVPGAFILLLTVNFYLNRALGLGFPAVTADMGAYFLIILLGLINGILGSWMFFFGEEYGWRVYLQDRLTMLFGRVKGVLIIGVVWGLWHAPVIAMGYNYPGQPVLGIIAMTLFTVVMGIIFSFAVFKTSSVWIAVLLHLITNTLAPSAMMYISNPKSSIFSFGIGIYGIGFMAVFALLLFIFKDWRESSREMQD